LLLHGAKVLFVVANIAERDIFIRDGRKMTYSGLTAHSKIVNKLKEQLAYACEGRTLCVSNHEYVEPEKQVNKAHNG